MAGGFYPHVGVSLGNYTALPQISAVSFLDSLVGDLTGNVGGTVNGWSLYDDLRAVGSSYPLWVPAMTNGGGVIGSYNNPGSTNSYRLISGSLTGTAYTGWGMDWSYALASFTGTAAYSGGPGSPLTISVDPAGTNAYQAYYLTTAGSYSTCSLDRPFAQPTVGFRIFYKKVVRYVVFRQTSGAKTFYVLVGQTNEFTGGAQMYVQVYETWNATTHQGTFASAIEHTSFWVDLNVSAAATMKYVAWFIPEVFAVWTAGNPGWGSSTERFTYVGNLDTSGLRTGDADALVFVPGETTLTGYHNSAVGAGQTARTLIPGAAQCLRTLQGEPWSMPDTVDSGYYLRNFYYPFPRGRWYAFAGNTTADADAAQRFQFTDLDLYQGDHQFYGEGFFSQGEGRRGMLRYVKIPSSSPMGMHLSTIGPAQDGNTYMFIRQNQTVVSRVSSQNTGQAYVEQQLGYANPLATGWAFSVVYGTSGEVQTTNPGIGSYNWLMMPVF